MINRERLKEAFCWLVGIDSVSKEEGNIASALRERLADLGASSIQVDGAAEAVSGQTGNLIAKFPGNTGAAPLMLNAHMDTVEPGRGVRPVFKEGLFTSDGTTILGADDKSAVAILLEVIAVLQERHLNHGPLEVVLTICEEIGLLGAKHLDYSLLDARQGYALDASDPLGIITRAPAANQLELKLIGRAAHAGAAPELGINAISLAGKAIAELPMGRIDEETTCNLGVIQGGRATNIVPELVSIMGEVRSHDEKKLAGITEQILATFRKVVDDHRLQIGEKDLPAFEARVESEFPATRIPEDHPVIALARKAAGNLGRPLECKTTGGGADANIFFQRGIVVGVMGTGMKQMHSVRESVHLDDMADAAELMIEIIRLHGQTEP
jgi:tripeptide aminopeptidase